MQRPDPARSAIVLIGTFEHADTSDLADVSAVANNLTDLAAALADPDYGIPGAPAPVVERNPQSVADLGLLLARTAKRAEDLMLVYYAGHGLLDERGQLYLALTGTETALPIFTAFPYDGLRRVLLDCPARNRVVILDCCYSGRAIDALSDPDAPVYEQTAISGTCVLTATAANVPALAPPGARHTLFTGALLDLLRDGAPDAPELLTLDLVFRHLHRTLTGAGHPQPRQRGTDTAAHLILARNRARNSEQPLPGDWWLQRFNEAIQATTQATRTPTAGAWARVEQLFADLVTDCTRLRGADDDKTLDARRMHAERIGMGGDPRRAAQLLADLVEYNTRVRGADDGQTLLSRSSHAWFIGDSGSPLRAAQLFADLVEYDTRVRGADDGNTLSDRWRHAQFVARAGSPLRAARLFADLVTDNTRVRGADHAQTLIYRWWHAQCIGQADNPLRAAELLATLVEDDTRVLGADHDETLRSRWTHAQFVGQAGNPLRAARLFADLVTDNTRVRGGGHPETVSSRQSYAQFLSQASDSRRPAQLIADPVVGNSRVSADRHETSNGSSSDASFTIEARAASWRKRWGNRRRQ